MNVKYKTHSGNDMLVVNAARVSFDKESNWDRCSMRKSECDLPDCVDTNICWQPYKLSEKDTKLIQYLAKNGHWTPFGHPTITLVLKAPIFVARQAMKSQVGFVVNEVSRRYVDSEPEYYDPEKWRMAAENKKQGSSSDTVSIDNLLYCVDEGHLTDEQGVMYHPKRIARELAESASSWMDDDFEYSGSPNPYHAVMEQCLVLYDQMIKLGVCPEQARMVLPQSMYTEWYWTGSLHAWSRFYNLRSEGSAQKEIQELAAQVDSIIRTYFPVSWEALVR